MKTITGKSSIAIVWICSGFGWACKAHSQAEAEATLEQGVKRKCVRHDPRPRKPFLSSK